MYVPNVLDYASSHKVTHYIRPWSRGEASEISRANARNGAQCFTGDGEVNGTAIEMSRTPTLHRGTSQPMNWPRAVDRDFHHLTGMDVDLDEAARLAIRESVAFLQERAGFSVGDAYALCSLAVDFRIAEAVNHVKVVYGTIPKREGKKADHGRLIGRSMTAATTRRARHAL
jgi:hypothetical protein